VTDARGNTAGYEYDALGRRTRVVLPDGTSVSTAYDALGRMVGRTDQAGKTTRYEYDALSRLVKVLDALDQATTFSYDEVGNLLTQTDANNHSTRFEYDRMRRRVRRTLPLGMSETYAYDVAGQLTSRTDFNGRKTTYAHDAMGRLLSKTPDPSLGQPAVVYTYNAQGLRASMSDASGLTTYAYDARDRLKSKSTPQGALNYGYDAAGNLTAVNSSNPGGLSVEYDYDRLDRLAAINDRRHGAGRTAYEYDEVGNLSSAVYANGVRTAYTYDRVNHLTSLASGQGATLASYSYTLGPVGNRLSVTELSGRQVSYTYDDLYRLTGEAVSSDPHGGDGSVEYAYDPVGNRKTRRSSLPGVAASAHEYDANDRLTTDTYDAGGNTLASGGRTYEFDFEDRITSVDGGAVRFVYNGDGQRVAKSVGGVTTEYLVDDNNPTGHAQVVEELQGGSVRRVYTYGHNLVSQRQLLGGAWSASFYGYDGSGNVRYLTDEAGAVTDTYDYDAFGALLHRTGATPNNYLYAGEQFDEHLGMLYLRARYLNTDTGRFFTRDTFEGHGFDPVSLHKYLYANADPVNMRDPSGLVTFGDIKVVLGFWMSAAMALLSSRLLAAACLTSLKVIVGVSLASGLAAGLISASGGGSFVGPFFTTAAGSAVVMFVLLTLPEAAVYGPLLLPYGINLTVEETGEAVGEGKWMKVGLIVTSVFALPFAYAKLSRFLAARQAAPQTNSRPQQTGPQSGPRGDRGRPTREGCFTAGTEIATAEGERPIEEVSAGDLVWARDEKSGEVALRRVVRTFRVVVSMLVVLTVGGEQIETTRDHPLWVVGRGWVKGQEVRPGDLLLTKDGDTTPVDQVAYVEGSFPVYNFEVEGFHTYFVSRRQVFVHNKAARRRGGDDDDGYTPTNRERANAKREDSFKGGYAHAQDQREFRSAVNDLRTEGIHLTEDQIRRLHEAITSRSLKYDYHSIRELGRDMFGTSR
jgi:RHS repeat-associated protein